MKIKLMLVGTLSAMLLVGCGDASTESVSGSVESDTGAENVEEAEEVAEEATEQINQVIADNENFKITLLDIAKVSDDIWGNSIEVKFDVENKRAETITVQARDVSADGRMVDDALIMMSDDIATGKVGTVRLEIMELDGYDFPELNSDLELTLRVFSWDNYDYQEEIPVKVSF